MWALRMLTGSRPSPTVTSPYSSIDGNVSEYGGGATVPGVGRQRRHHRRRPYRSLTRRSHSGRVKHRTSRHKVRRVGVQASTGKILFRGTSGGKFTRGLHNRRNYV